MSKRTLILGFFILLFVLHQDFWWRDDPRLVLGIMPVSLAYHVFWTVLVAFGWFLVARFCWPHELDKETPAAMTDGTRAGDSERTFRGAGGTPALPDETEHTRR